jgi:hypothetical protein
MNHCEKALLAEPNQDLLEVHPRTFFATKSSGVPLPAVQVGRNGVRDGITIADLRLDSDQESRGERGAQASLTLSELNTKPIDKQPSMLLGTHL